MALKDKGFSYATIDKLMDRAGIDNQIKVAKTNAFSNLFEQAFSNGQYDSASAALANLVEVNPQRASAYMSMFPQYKDFFNIKTARDNAQQAHKYRQEDTQQAQKFALERAELAAKVRASATAAQNNAKAARDYQNRVMKYQSLQGMVDSGQMTEAQRVAYAFGDYKPVGSSSKNSDGTPKPTKADTELHQQFVNKWNDAYAKAVGTDNEASGEALDELQNFAKEQFDKGKIDQEYYERMMSKVSAALAIRAKTAGYEDEAAGYLQNVNDDDWKNILNPRGIWKSN